MKMKKRIKPKTFGPPQLELPRLTPDEELQLDYDLCCCIEELESLLRQKPTERQKKLAETTLRILKNPGESMIRKKQAMRQQFGDYRKKFEGKRKEILSNLNSSNATFTNTNVPKDSLFVRKHKVNSSEHSSNSTTSTLPDNHAESNSDVPSNKNKFVFTVSDNSFRFNF